MNPKDLLLVSLERSDDDYATFEDELRRLIDDDQKTANLLQLFLIRKLSKGASCPDFVQVTPLFRKDPESDHGNCYAFEVNIEWRRCIPGTIGQYQVRRLDRRIPRLGLLGQVASHKVSLLVDIAMLVYHGGKIVEIADLSHE